MDVKSDLLINNGLASHMLNNGGEGGLSSHRENTALVDSGPQMAEHHMGLNSQSPDDKLRQLHLSGALLYT